MTDMAAPSAQRGNKWRVVFWSGAGFLLLLPAIAMQFTQEVDWTASDFVVWAMMLGVAGGLYEFATRLSGDRFYRAGVATAVLTGFLITWSNLAVGIIGDEDNGVNLLFFVLLAVALAGAAVVRFRARGLALVATLAGLAQLAIALAALSLGWDPHGAKISLVFVALWFSAAALLRRAAVRTA